MILSMILWSMLGAGLYVAYKYRVVINTILMLKFKTNPVRNFIGWIVFVLICTFIPFIVLFIFLRGAFRSD